MIIFPATYTYKVHKDLFSFSTTEKSALLDSLASETAIGFLGWIKLNSSQIGLIIQERVLGKWLNCSARWIFLKIVLPITIIYN